MGSGTVKLVDQKKLDERKQILIDCSKKSGQRLQVGSGLHGQSGIQRVQPTFHRRSDRTIIVTPDSAGATIFDNNPEYAKEGADFCSRVSMIAGINGHKLKEDDVIGDPDLLKSAASVVVRQRAKSQDALSLVIPNLDDGGGTTASDREGKSYEAFSDVTAYADVIQLVARNGGVNLYAGGVDSELSNGVPNREPIGVNLIYGNKIEKDEKSPYSLQPLVKGDALVKALSDQSDRIKKLGSVVFQIQADMSFLKIFLAMHTHPMTPLGITTPSLELAIATGASAIKDVFNMLNLVTEQWNTIASEWNASIATKGNILSRWNKTN